MFNSDPQHAYLTGSVLYLMGPTDEVEVVSVEELAHHVRPKGEADPTIILTPALNILVRVRPQQVTQQS